jgi:hypothetical protein
MIIKAPISHLLSYSHSFEIQPAFAKMDKNNFTLTISLLPDLIMMSDKDLNTDLPVKTAAYFALFPLFLLILTGEVLRRLVKRKISSTIIKRPEPTKFIHIDGSCDEEYGEIRQAF